MPPRVLASGPKPCGGKKTVEEVSKEQDSQCKVDDVLKWDVTKMQLRAAAIKHTAEEEKNKKQKFFFTLVILCPKVFKAEILPGYCTDHSMIVIQQKLHTLISIKRS